MDPRSAACRRRSRGRRSGPPGRLAAHRAGGRSAAGGRHRSRARRDLPRGRERFGQVDGARGSRPRVRVLPRGRLESGAALDTAERVAAVGLAGDPARRRREQVGVLPPRRDDARVLHLPRGQPDERAGTRVPRDESRGVVSGDPRHTIRPAGFLLPRRTGGGAVVLLDAGAYGDPPAHRPARRPGALRDALAHPGVPPGCTRARTGRVGHARDAVGDLELVHHWRAYLDSPRRYLRHLLE